ncbi:MAG: class I SAM-dependent methyltransferase [Planctomycetota bacterium]|nr:class I SAM-dependent methyltransferase [Planctomycetota bacterium]
MAEPQQVSSSSGKFAERYYDDYVVKMSARNTARTLERTAAVLDLCGAGRGRLLGVGAGNLSEGLAYKQAGFEVTVIDVTASLREQAEAAGLRFHQANLETDPLPGPYDVVCCMEVLEHLLDPLGALKKLAGAAAPGGRLFVSLPEEFHAVARLRVLVGRPAFSHYNWPHIRFFNLRAARELAADAGLEIVAVRHMPLVPPRMGWLHPLGRLLGRLLPGLFTISHVFELRPAGGAVATSSANRRL